MGNPSPVLYSMTLALLVVASASVSASEWTQSLDRWFENLRHQKAATTTLTKLQIYIHADFSTASPNQTVFQIASAEITPESPSNFGRVLAIDNPFTTGPDPGSHGLGRYQGMNGFSDFNEVSATMFMNIIFSEGSEYVGSTLSILGRQPINQEVRVLSILGGTGAFRLATGTVLASTYSTDPRAQTGVYVYDMYILTPSVGGSAIQIA